ncbi:MAG TPA: glycosyltransferase, partial [Terriglobales bacterium]|nr:glycosyltransferase [Terriglobales bacterium]
GPAPDAVNCIRHLVETSPKESASKIGYVPNWLLRSAVIAIRYGLFRKKRQAGFIRAVSERPAFLQTRMRRIDRVIAPSNTMRELLVRNHFDADRITRLPYGIHAQNIERSERKGNEGHLRIAFIGQVYEHKGCHVLVEAVRSLRKLPIHLRIHGDLTQSPAYVERLRKLAEGDRKIEFAGRFPNDKVSDVLKETDVLVCPSLWYENTPLVIYEAMAAGVPVVASDLQGMAEAIKPEINGLLFPPGDVTALAEALRRLEGDRPLVARLSVNTEQPLTVKAHVSELEKLYQQVLEARNAAGHRASLDEVKTVYK